MFFKHWKINRENAMLYDNWSRLQKKSHFLNRVMDNNIYESDNYYTSNSLKYQVIINFKRHG